MDILLKISSLCGLDKALHYTLNYLVSNDYLNPIETIAMEGFTRDISLAIPNKFLFS